MLAIGITGIRDLPRSSHAIVQKTIEAFVFAYPHASFYFGGATGTDTLALTCAAKAKAHCCIVIVPFTVAKQPIEARRAIKKYADKICELDLPNVKNSFLRRNDMIVEKSNFLVGFTDGRKFGGTHYTRTKTLKEEKLFIGVLV